MITMYLYRVFRILLEIIGNGNFIGNCWKWKFYWKLLEVEFYWEIVGKYWNWKTKYCYIIKRVLLVLITNVSESPLRSQYRGITWCQTQHQV